MKPWTSVREDILRHLKEDSESISTTMVDFYGMPRTGNRAWPGRDVTASSSVDEKANSVEDAIKADICMKMGVNFDHARFIPYVMMHEYEGILFSDPSRFAQGIGQSDLSLQFGAIRNQFDSPEAINDSQVTALSKRIISLFPRYKKPLHGTLAAKAIGLDIIRQECPNFRRWIEQLETST